jgi:hypothetical protein
MATIRIRPYGLRPWTLRPLVLRPYGGYAARGKTLAGCHRSENDSLARYEVHVGEDEQPDLTAAATATSTTLPMAVSLDVPVSGSTVFHVVGRTRNKYGLISGETIAQRVEIGSDGVRDTNPPAAPEDITAEATTSGAIRVTARYYFADDVAGDGRATYFRVYAKVGSDPVPGVDAVTASVVMTHLSAVALLNTTLTGYSNGNVVHVLVRSYRLSDTMESENTTAVTATALTSAGMGTVTAAIHGGVVNRQ